jgi:hypothetical protein
MTWRRWLWGFSAAWLASGCGMSAASDPLEGIDAPARLGAPDAPVASSTDTAFRFNRLMLADPHLWFGQGNLCFDITDSVNTVATNVLEVDGSKPPDGLLDGSIALVFHPFDPSPGKQLAVDLEVPVCSAPATGSTCSAGADTPKYDMTATVQTTGSCIELIDGTVSAHPLPVVPSAPCFGTASTAIKLSFLGADITLADAQGAASWDGDQLDVGLIRGFLSLTDAQAIVIDIPGFLTAPLSHFLYGGGSCHDSPDLPMGDMDVGPGGEMGWYVYVTFSAEKVPYVEK